MASAGAHGAGGSDGGRDPRAEGHPPGRVAGEGLANRVDRLRVDGLLGAIWSQWCSLEKGKLRSYQVLGK